ncbi:MAG: double zinc ribbon domain-containing protein [Sphingopyxis sp.]
MAGGGKKLAGRLRHAPLVPFPAMLHKRRMATATGDVEEKHALPGALSRGLRSAARTIVDFALPPRCPGCGVIVGEDRQFCLTCWTSLDFHDGPARSQCSVPLPAAPSGG